MEWKSFFIGIAFLGGMFFFYKTRNWRKMKGDDLMYASINATQGFQSWVMIILCAIAGVLFIINSLP